MQKKNESVERDRKTAEGMIEGRRDAYNEFAERFSGFIYGEALRFCGDCEEASDLVNEMLIRMVMTIGRYDCDRGSLTTWVMKVARHYLTDLYRKTKDDPEVIACEDSFFDLYPSEYKPDEFANAMEETAETEIPPEIEKLEKAMFDISLRDRQILQYRAEGYSYEDICEFLGIKRSTAMTAWSRAVKKIKARYGKEDAA